MKLLPALVAAALLLAAPAGSRAQGSACPSAGILLGALSKTQVSGAVGCIVNESRTSAGLPPLSHHRKLYKAARSHTKDMQTRLHRLTHRSSSGKSLAPRVGSSYARGASSWRVGEVIGERFGAGATPQVIVSLWLGSPIHRRVILDPKFIHLGVAARKGTTGRPGAYGAVVTADFGFRAG